jgi:molecular chaperone DnaJ
MAQKDFYAALGLSSKATADEIKRQYRRLAKLHHPDSNKGDGISAERFKEISEAYQVLGDERKRKQYDDLRRRGTLDGLVSRSSRAGGTGSTRPGTARPRGPAGTSRPADPGAAPGARSRGSQGGSSGAPLGEFDVGGFGGFSNPFGAGFGAGTGRARPPAGPQAGQNVEAVIVVPFRTAALGGSVPLELELSDACAACGGSGTSRDVRTQICSECGARGTVTSGQGGFAANQPCPTCHGSGIVPPSKCAACDGSGTHQVRKQVNVTVPPGVDNGSNIRLAGEGGRGLHGGPPGDIMVTVQVKPDERWSREGLDLVVHTPVHIVQAMLGSKVRLRTLDKKTVSIKVPAGTSAGKRFRVRGQGIAKEGKRGDLLVEVSLTVPENLREDDFEVIARSLQKFLAGSDARCTMLVDRSGQLLATVGEEPHFDPSAFALLTASDFMANDRLAQHFGETEFNSLFHRGEKESMYLVDVARHVILVVLFDARVPLGLLRLNLKEAVGELTTLFEEVSLRGSDEQAQLQDFPRGAEDESDRLIT